jgi:ATP-binding cassette subfamily B multidrug efflux pump
MSKLHPFQFWRRYVRRRWPVYLFGISMVVITSAFQVFSSRLIGWIIDFFQKGSLPDIFPENIENEFQFLFILLFVSVLLVNLSRMGWRRTLGRETLRAAALFKGMLWDGIRFIPRRILEKDFTIGVLLNIGNSDVSAARFVFGWTIVMITDTLFLGVISLIAMAMINIELTIISLLILLIIPVMVKRLSEQEVKNYEVSQKSLGEFHDLASQSVHTVKMQKLSDTSQFWRGKLIESAENYRVKNLMAVFTSLKYIPLMWGAAIGCDIVLFVLGIRYVLTNELSVGDFVAMQGLIHLLQEPLIEMGFVISDWKKGFSSLKRIASVVNVKKDEAYSQENGEIDESEIIFNVKKLSFSYGDQSIIKSLDLKITKGERIGITGKIGSGKSTLVNLLAGLERNHEGEILFNGKSFVNYSYENIRNYMGVVPQKTFLFANSISNNMKLDRDLSDDEIYHYLNIAGISEEISGFPEKLNTELGEWGINLSGGQKQRITLARAISRKPRVLLLDDCLSAVDTITEEKILKNLDEELADTTLIWVAHRKSTLKYCSRVIEL